MRQMPEGDYQGHVIRRAEAGRLKNERKTPYIDVFVDLSAYRHKGNWVAVPEDGSRQRVRLFLSEKAFPYTVQKLNGLGFNGNFDSPELECSDLVDLVCRKDRGGYVSFDFPKLESGTEPLDRTTAQRLAARYRQTGGRPASSDRPQTQPEEAPVQSPTPQPPEPQPDDDDQPVF